MLSRDATPICKYPYSTSFDVKKTSSSLLFFPDFALPTKSPAGSQNRPFADTFCLAFLSSWEAGGMWRIRKGRVVWRKCVTINVSIFFEGVE